MDYTIREITEREYNILEDFLYEAVFVPEGMPAPSRSIIRQPELQVYISDFGKKKDDIGLLAEVGDKVVGAVWVRIMDDYGHFAFSKTEDINNHRLRFKKKIMRSGCI